jgi:dGTPase
MATYPEVSGRRLIHEIVRRMINYVVTDLVETTSAMIAEAAPESVDDVRAGSGPLVLFSDRVAAEHQELKQYLRDHVYRHYRVLRMTSKARTVVSGLFEAFFSRIELLPTEHFEAAIDMETQAGEAGRARAVADYIAGMTDRYAITEYERMFDPAQRS